MAVGAFDFVRTRRITLLRVDLEVNASGTWIIVTAKHVR